MLLITEPSKCEKLERLPQLTSCTLVARLQTDEKEDRGLASNDATRTAVNSTRCSKPSGPNVVTPQAETLYVTDPKSDEGRKTLGSLLSQDTGNEPAIRVEPQ